MIDPTKIIMALHESGAIIASRDQFKTFDVVVPTGHLHSDYANLLANAAVLYTAVAQAIDAMASIASIADSYALDALAVRIYDCEAALRNARDIARDGLGEFAKRKESK